MNESRDSVCMRPCAVLCSGLASLHACEGPPHRRGPPAAAAQRSDGVCAHLGWAGPSGDGREPAAPRPCAADPLPGCCMSALLGLCASSSGSEWSGAVRENSGAAEHLAHLETPALGSGPACGEGRAGLPAQESLWAPCWPRGSGSGGLGRVTEGAGPSLLPSEFFLGLPG